MSQFLTDTHALHWHLTNDARLSQKARRLFQETDQGLHQILIPSIILVELVYLAEKGRLPDTLVHQVFSLLDTMGGSYAIAPLDEKTAAMLRNVDRNLVPDMPDRIITATALQFNLPLITRDAKIRQSGIVPTIW